MVSKVLSLLAVPLAGVAAQVSWPTLQNISLTQYNISGFEADRLGKYSYQFEYFDHYTGFIGACAGSGDSSEAGCTYGVPWGGNIEVAPVAIASELYGPEHEIRTNLTIHAHYAAAATNYIANYTGKAVVSPLFSTDAVVTPFTIELELVYNGTAI
ncbi:uncharacterized protein TRUGW13939_10947 [Talaromyces rugulosus]|uniref:Uncharacterized protein n=1 Tax=Talaromyces rugulosus TaxID=121627 RepID=A0A7H8RBS8_TALRU|nr:uncharacterized protein TRUGW13939_10947 [Talaromyces rugulosus]QKX63776.1 hypothetical protein TRUGW13939_10947 [Talaromyces rugulosus]